jgi:hypothetical protein
LSSGRASGSSRRAEDAFARVRYREPDRGGVALEDPHVRVVVVHERRVRGEGDEDLIDGEDLLPHRPVLFPPCYPRQGSSWAVECRRVPCPKSRTARNPAKRAPCARFGSPAVGSVLPARGSVGPARGSVGPRVGSVGPRVETVGPAVGTVGLAVGSVGSAVGSVGSAVETIGSAVETVGPAVGSVGPAGGSSRRGVGRPLRPRFAGDGARALAGRAAATSEPPIVTSGTCGGAPVPGKLTS